MIPALILKLALISSKQLVHNDWFNKLWVVGVVISVLRCLVSV